MEQLYEKLSATSPVSAVILALAIVLLSGFLMTRITKLLRLPNVTAYIVAGIIIGPFCLKAVPQNVIDGSAFISDVALAFIAFSAGEYFRFSSFKGKGKQLVIITVLEALTASLLVFILTYFILGLGIAFSLVLSALASATAPASTLMTIRQTGAKGDFVDTLISVVAFDDVVSLFAFSIAISVAMAAGTGTMDSKTVLLPLLYNVIMLVLGVALGFALKFFMAKRSTDNRLIVGTYAGYLLNVINYDMAASTSQTSFQRILDSESIDFITCPWNYGEREIGQILTGFSVSLCKAIKEIPGFAAGTFDRDKIFMSLIKEGQK